MTTVKISCQFDKKIITQIPFWLKKYLTHLSRMSTWCSLVLGNAIAYILEIIDCRKHHEVHVHDKCSSFFNIYLTCTFTWHRKNVKKKHRGIWISEVTRTSQYNVMVIWKSQGSYIYLLKVLKFPYQRRFHNKEYLNLARFFLKVFSPGACNSQQK